MDEKVPAQDRKQNQTDGEKTRRLWGPGSNDNECYKKNGGQLCPVLLRDFIAISLGFSGTSLLGLPSRHVGTAAGLRVLTEDRITGKNFTDEDSLRNETRIRTRVLDKLKAKGQCKENLTSPEERHGNSKANHKIIHRAGGQSEHLELTPEGVRVSCDERSPNSSTF